MQSKTHIPCLNALWNIQKEHPHSYQENSEQDGVLTDLAFAAFGQQFLLVSDCVQPLVLLPGQQLVPVYAVHLVKVFH